ANHFVTEHFANNNMELLDLDDESAESSYVYSERRAQALENRLGGIGAKCSLDTVATTLDVEPTLNENTYQQMVFCPATGEVKVRRRLIN
ncbi:MAG TPA: hypothetical protein VJ020_04640, partial [Anaerolineales bacterium]|nr:hypothetical protein [Anaerolineales bacterium]